jgi:hypothetical protein
MTLHLTYEEKKQRAYEKRIEYRNKNEEMLRKYNKEYYEKNYKDNNKYYNYDKKHSKDIYYRIDTKKEKEKKLIYIMNYFISNNIIWT